MLMFFIEIILKKFNLISFQVKINFNIFESIISIKKIKVRQKKRNDSEAQKKR